ncbi:hypothetical protein BD324DRAFT_652340 [Kockovaella imperatae]|uniref:Uncharacterized protein n=1 Tax=Kockovaella imperatae TaxID=4999 RepID=A0A1Y1UFF0_9TREE|nr:hypothetical protein BD324DRAFT_652340 [Kockovaella imperatae]ORX35805.1 hypothetical protein BD324DRAFT_652340 [Kockovaella imperatae]
MLLGLVRPADSQMIKTTQAKRNQRYQLLHASAVSTEPLLRETGPVRQRDVALTASIQAYLTVDYTHGAIDPRNNYIDPTSTVSSIGGQLKDQTRSGGFKFTLDSARTGSRCIRTFPVAQHCSTLDNYRSRFTALPIRSVEHQIDYWSPSVSLETSLFAGPNINTQEYRKLHYSNRAERNPREQEGAKMPMSDALDSVFERLRLEKYLDERPLAGSLRNQNPPLFSGRSLKPSVSAEANPGRSRLDQQNDGLGRRDREEVADLTAELHHRTNALHAQLRQASMEPETWRAKCTPLENQSRAKNESLEETSKLLGLASVRLLSDATTIKTLEDDLSNLSLQLDARTKELDAERSLREAADAARVDAEVKEMSACKHQSTLAKHLREANDKLAEVQKSKDQEAEGRMKAEKRAVDAEQAARRNGRWGPPVNARVVAELQNHIKNLKGSLERCNVQLADSKAKTARLKDKIEQIRADNTGLRARNDELTQHAEMQRKAEDDRNQSRKHLQAAESALTEHKARNQALQERLDEAVENGQLLAGQIQAESTGSLSSQLDPATERGVPRATSEVISNGSSDIVSTGIKEPNTARAQSTAFRFPTMVAQMKDDPIFEEATTIPSQAEISDHTNAKQEMDPINIAPTHVRLGPTSLGDLSSISSGMTELAAIGPGTNTAPKDHFIHLSQARASRDPYIGLESVFVHSTLPVSPPIAASPVSSRGREPKTFDHLLDHLQLSSQTLQPSVGGNSRQETTNFLL